MSTKNRKELYYYIFGTICMLIPALINNFPFIYSDSGTYVGVGFSGGISEIRPAMYGAFIRHISLKESLWLVILVQSLMMCFVIRSFIKSFFLNIDAFTNLIIVGILTTTTSIGVYTGMLMPDFTASFLILIPLIILYQKNKKSVEVIILIIFLWFTIASHHSHAYILFLILLIFFSIKLVTKSTNKNSVKRMGLVFVITLIGYFTIPIDNYFRSGTYFHSKSRNIFLVGRINQTGLLEPFLEENCNEKKYSICNYRNNLPINFLWDRGSPVYKDKGWIDNNRLYGDVIEDFFTSPYYFKRFLIKTIETAVQQFFSFNTVQLDKIEKNKWPHFEFNRYIPDSIPSIESSLQTQGKLNFGLVDFLQKGIVFISFLFVVNMLFFNNTKNIDYKNIIRFILYGLMSNAFICGGISVIAPRFQSRIIWVVPFLVICILLNNPHLKRKLSSLTLKEAI